MKKTTLDSDVSIVIFSCDQYSDLWEPFFNVFFEMWPDCPFPVYLTTNQKTFNHNRVKSLPSGPDINWSDSMKSSLRQITHKYIWVFFDDVFITSKVSRKEIEKIVNILSTHSPAYLRFQSAPKPDERVSHYYGRFKEDTLYRTSIYAIWDKEIFLSLLKSGESAWDFELCSVERAENIYAFFGTYRNVFSVTHGVVKGYWLPPAMRFLKRKNINLDASKRKKMPFSIYVSYLMARLRFKILIMLPSRYRPLLQKIKQKVTSVLPFKTSQY